LPCNECDYRAVVQQHIAESDSMRNTIVENRTKVGNLETWVPKLESNMADMRRELNSKIDSNFVKTILSVVGVNILTVVGAIMALIGLLADK